MYVWLLKSFDLIKWLWISAFFVFLAKRFPTHTSFSIMLVFCCCTCYIVITCFSCLDFMDDQVFKWMSTIFFHMLEYTHTLRVCILRLYTRFRVPKNVSNFKRFRCAVFFLYWLHCLELFGAATNQVAMANALFNESIEPIRYRTVWNHDNSDTIKIFR